MPEPIPPKTLISYAHEGASHDSGVRGLADQLTRDGVQCDLDQYDEAPQQGWPSWIAERIFDSTRFILVVSSPSYLRRWILAERAGVGLGAKYEGKLIRQALYDQEGLNGRVIPVVLEPNEERHIPPELRDTTRYRVRPDPRDRGYDKLLRRLTAQPLSTAPPLGAPVTLLDRQETALASVLYILQRVPAPFPVDVLSRAAGLAPDSLLSAARGEPGPPILNWHEDDLLTTTYYRPVHPLPPSPGQLLSEALDTFLSRIRQHGAYDTTRDDIRNVLVLASAGDVRRDVVARVFEIAQTAVKRLGDKRLVWQAATLSLTAAQRQPRHREHAEAEARALICGQSWVLQRVNKLENAEAVAVESLTLGKKLPWPRNTAFCSKCLGRLCRLRAEATDDGAARRAYLTKSERYLLDAITAFEGLADSDRHGEIGDCHSLLGRTLLVANRLEEARAAAQEAQSLLNESGDKDYQDLQILHGDLIAAQNPDAAEGFYSGVIQECANDDARYSEIRARAYSARAETRLARGRRLHAQSDFQAAADIWRQLQDPAVSDAEWGVLTCTERRRSIPLS